jgi:hypothetical protein
MLDRRNVKHTDKEEREVTRKNRSRRCKSVSVVRPNKDIRTGRDSVTNEEKAGRGKKQKAMHKTKG